MGVNSLPKTVTRQRRDCDSNPGPSAPESSTLTTRLPSHPDSKIASRIDSTIRDTILLTRAQKPTRVSLIYRTEPTTKKWKTEKKLKRKNGYARKYR